MWLVETFASFIVCLRPPQRARPAGPGDRQADVETWCPARLRFRSAACRRVCRPRRLRAMARPWPVPLPTSLVVKNGSKMRERTSTGIPLPVSPIAISTCSSSTRVATRILPLSARALDHVGDRMRGVDDQIEDHLVDLAGVAVHQRQLVETGFDLGDVFVFVGGDDQRARDRLVDVDLRHLLAIRMREFLHRAHDGGDAAETVARAVERDRRVLEDVVEIGVVLGLLSRLGGGRDDCIVVLGFCVALRSSRYLSTMLGRGRPSLRARNARCRTRTAPAC